MRTVEDYQRVKLDDDEWYLGRKLPEEPPKKAFGVTLERVLKLSPSRVLEVRLLITFFKLILRALICC